MTDDLESDVYVHIGDLHLTTGPRNEDRVRALDEAIETALERFGPRRHGRNQIKGWFVPGDLSHSGMTIPIRNVLAHKVVAMANVAPVVVVSGNHDPEHDLDFLALLRARHDVHVVTQPQVVTIEPGPMTGPGGLAVFCLPYPTRGGLVERGVTHDQLGTKAAHALDLIFMEAAAKLQQYRDSGWVTMTIGHVNVAGSLASSGQPQIGQEIEVSERHIQRLGHGYVGLNHIHRHQKVGGAYYAGSLCRLDWGETEPKGFIAVHVRRLTNERPVLVGAETSGLASVMAPPPVETQQSYDYRVEFVQLNVPPMFHVEGTLTRDGFEHAVTKGPGGATDEAPATWDGVDVRVRMSYAREEKDALGAARERVKAVFAGARRLVLEPVPIVTRPLRAPAVVQARTLDGKLRAYAAEMGVTWTDAIERCSSALLATDRGDEVVAEAGLRMDALVSEPPETERVS